MGIELSPSDSYAAVLTPGTQNVATFEGGSLKR